MSQLFPTTHPHAPGNHYSALCLYRVEFRTLIEMLSHHRRHFMFGFFHFTWCLQGLFTPWNVSVLHSFPWLRNILLYGLVTFCLSIHQCMGIWVFRHFLAILKNDAMTIHVQGFFLFEHLFSILLDIYVGMELLGHIIILCLTLWGTAKLVFRRGYAILCSYRQCMRFSIFPHPYNTGYFLLILFYFSHRCEVVSHCCF